MIDFVGVLYEKKVSSYHIKYELTFFNFSRSTHVLLAI